MNNTDNYTVTGVVPDFPKNVTLQFNWLATFDDYLDEQAWLKTYSGGFGRIALVALEPGVNPDVISQQLTSLIRPKDMAYAKVNMALWPMKDWHLYDHFTNGKEDGGNIKFVKLFFAHRFDHPADSVYQFHEPCYGPCRTTSKRSGGPQDAWRHERVAYWPVHCRVYATGVLFGLIGCIARIYCLTCVHVLVDKDLAFHPLTPAHFIGLLAISIICGLLSGSYPAFYLSSFNPVAVLKGLKVQTRGSAGFIRKGLVTTQFVISVALIICTVIIYQQIQHVKDRDLGLQQQNLLYLDVQGNMSKDYNAIRDDLMATGTLQQVALSYSPPLNSWSGTDNQYTTWDGDDVTSKEYIAREAVSPGYIETMGLKIKSGRDFYADAKLDSSSVIINESLAALMGKAGKPGNRLSLFDGKHHVPRTIVGVVGNFVFNDMYGKPSPMMLICDPAWLTHCNSIDMRLKPGTSPSSAIAKITDVVRADNPGFPVEVKFADAQYDKHFTDETRIGKLASLFALLAISISCLGLFGLAAYTAEQRTKELGIRKVLGASIHSLTGLLSREFLLLVALSCLIAFPIAWWAMNNWLASYAYRTTIHWWVFAGAGLGALAIALLTVSFQALKAALAILLKRFGLNEQLFISLLLYV